MKYFSLIIILLLIVSCGDSTTKDTSPPVAVETPTAPAAATVLYPTLSEEKAAEIYTKTDYMDYLFYELEFSMNHGRKEDIQNAIRYISTSPITSNIPKCPSIGRIFYQAKGEIIAEAEFHFNSEAGCFYLIFLEDGKPKYGNLLTDVGASNYKNIFKQVKQ